MEYIEYKEVGNSVSAGFKKHNFVVYGTVNKTEDATKMDYLQRIYEQVKSSLDYEERQYDAGLPNSITTEQSGTEFVPDAPRPQKVILTLDKKYLEFGEEDLSLNVNYEVKVIDQYNEELAAPFTMTSDIGTIYEDYIEFPSIEEDIEAHIVATVEELEDIQTISLYAYQEMIHESVDRLANLEAQLRAAQDVILQLTDSIASVNLSNENILNEVADTKSQLATVSSNLGEVSTRVEATELFAPAFEEGITAVQSELAEAKHTMAGMQTEISMAEQALAETNLSIVDTNNQMLSVANSLLGVDDQIILSNNELTNTKEHLSILGEDLGNANQEIQDTKTNLIQQEQTIDIIIGGENLG